MAAPRFHVHDSASGYAGISAAMPSTGDASSGAGDRKISGAGYAPVMDRDGNVLPPIASQFKTVAGSDISDIPFKHGNVRPGHEEEDLTRMINTTTLASGCCDSCMCFFCAISVIGGFYLCAKQTLVEQGTYGFALNNGKPHILMAGRHLLTSPLTSFERKVSVGENVIIFGPVSIIRVPAGSFGLAMNNSEPEILLPGVHCRTSAAFKFERIESVEKTEIQFGPIKFLTVRSGGVRVCYVNGKVQIFSEGRYAINSGTFAIAGFINTQQCTLRFEKHPVLLDGGISLLVEGLLTFQCTDVETLIHQLGDVDLVRSIKDVTKAELARVFATIHLEEISSATSAPLAVASYDVDEKDAAVLGKIQDSNKEGETRTKICSQVMNFIRPLTTPWGVRIINFQLESTKIADEKYAQEYEAASLAMAKAKANLRAVDAENKIKIQRARADADAITIAAEAQKNKQIIEAKGLAEARTIEAKARNDAAAMMTDDFARALQLAGQQVEFAKSLKAKVLTVLPDSVVGQPLVSAGFRGSSLGAGAGGGLPIGASGLSALAAVERKAS